MEMIDKLEMDRDRYFGRMRAYHDEAREAAKAGERDVVNLYICLAQVYGDLTLHVCYALELEHQLKTMKGG